jgi:hypothetical protein
MDDEGAGMSGRAERSGGAILPAAIACAAALAAWLGAAGSAAPPPGFSVVYAPAPAANAIYDGTAGLPGLTDAVRQAPIFDDPRWPAERQMGKLNGRELSVLSVDQIVQAIRKELAGRPPGGLVAIDEITPNNWDEAHAAGFDAALAQLGPDAERVVVYVSPALVTQVGRTDLRKALDPKNAHLVAALRRAGAALLEMYHGNAGPFTQEEFAIQPTRWLARWAPADPGKLHMFFGYEQGVGWKGIFAWARATPAGRTILANGAGVYGLQTAREGLDWLSAYREFLASPTAPPPQGDYPVPVGGGLELRPPENRTVLITIDRPARAVIRLVPRGGGKARVIGVLNGPTPGVRVQMPRNVKAGLYDVVVVMVGDGLRDVVTIPAVVGRPAATNRLRLRYARGVLRVTLGAGNRTVIRVIPIRPTPGPTRAIVALRGPLRDRGVRVPPRVVDGRYRAVAVSVGADGRQSAGIRFTLKR